MPRTWFVVHDIPPALQLELRQIPGVRPRADGWLVPQDLGWMLGDDCPIACAAIVDAELKEMLGCQNRGMLHTLAFGSSLYRFDTGLGKTRTTLESIRYEKALPALVVSPSVVRGAWEDEVIKWWPKKSRPAVIVIESSMDLREWTGARTENSSLDFILVISYRLATINAKILKEIPWRAIVLDEVHNAKNSKSQQSGALAGIVANRPDVLKMWLSATPIANEPKDLFHIWDLLRPGACGTEAQFNARYSIEGETNEEGYREKPRGLNPEHAEELKRRCAFFTVEGFMHIDGPKLPELTTSLVKINASSRVKWRNVLDRWTMERKLHDATLDAFFLRAGSLKIEPAAELALEARRNGNSHVCVVTYYHETAHQIAELIEKAGERVIVVTGETPAGPRKKLLYSTKDMPECVVVCSMKSMNEGLTLTWFRRVICAELSYVPKDMIQLIGRFRRLGLKHPVLFQILCIKGTLDEMIAKRFREKSENIVKVFPGGLTETQLQETMAEPERDPKDVLQELFEVAAGFREDAYT